jgi:hypothetical protein
MSFSVALRALRASVVKKYHAAKSISIVAASFTTEAQRARSYTERVCLMTSGTNIVFCYIHFVICRVQSPLQ